MTYHSPALTFLKQAKVRINHLKLYFLWLIKYPGCAGVSIATVEEPPAKGLIDLEDNQWEVEELQGRRKVGRGFQYFVKWVGFPESENTWERKKDISTNFVVVYDAMHPFRLV
jgi:hypothetical protein